MKYYSDVLKSFYETEKDCLAAEEAYNLKLQKRQEAKAKLQAERKERAKEVEDAMKAAAEAKKHYDELLDAFCKDYGTFHYSFDTKDKDLFSILNSFLF